ncbi:unnamed protein product [Prorocentrum cordatum]|uniref:Uncharacterized protein n=1 Tax=Prorocentrum cordatum TaxID=2364126 RepID=A0ABN9RVM6_9DINO|nr:unnamed protein product [Polarella glacialis]|mmetsp:Transcript_107304/g.290721  ORF Transcript_107304/g.290721 Transcript_107304/m.290721 type:complete len:345 (+) Transcript_107304:84-1118(+)
MPVERRVPYYHYTSERGLEGILRDGRIQPSDPNRGDAREGPGSYGTNLPPSTCGKAIAENNWDSGWEQAIRNGKTDRWLRCEVPASELQQYPGHGSTQHGQILVHPQGIDLTKYPTKFGTVGKDTVPQGHRYVPPPDIAQGHRYMPGDAQTPERAISASTHDSIGWGHAHIKSAAPRHSSQDCSRNVVASQFEGPALDRSGYNDKGNRYASYNNCGYRYGSHDGSSYVHDARGGAVYTSPHGDTYGYPEHSGYNAQGNHYESYSDGSYRYDNQDGSSYVRDADGGAIYTSPDGDTYEYPSGGCSSGDHVDTGCYSDGCDWGGGGYGGGYSDGGYSGGGYSDADY